ncbi:MAG TPA: type VI secretion system contractile sheath small subunit [Pyrinomonadaceae bacterium]|nr:type VI secretion system contractile sheath small subunit [Pyrinomonadaceae bacterium]
MPESTQHKLDRIRPPRVQITYDVETRGSFVKMELPFVAGILAELSGDVADPKPLRERKYVEIDRDNFNEIMKSIGPKVALNGDGKTLSFESLDDFSPIKVLEKLELNARYQKRSHLSDLVAKLDGNVKLQEKLLGVLREKSKREELKKKVDELKAMVNEKPADQGQVESTEKPKDSEGGKKE